MQASDQNRGGAQVIPRPRQWQPGRPAPWADLVDPHELITPGRIREAFPLGRSGQASPVKELGADEFAVLVPVYGDASDLRIILTRRAQTLRTHRGEVSFPGGRAEPGETAVQAALREADEEIGLDPDSVEVLGELDHLTTITRRAYIVPVVGLLDGAPTGPISAGEVDKVLHVPIAELFAPGVFREEQWGAPGFCRPVYFFELVGDTVWGATAALLRQFLSVITGTDPGTGFDLDPARGAEMMHFDLDPDGMGGVV